MRKIKMFLIFSVILFNTFSFTSCDMNQSFDNNIPNDSSSIVNNDSELDDGIVLAEDIPHQFICLGNTYVKIEKNDSISFNCMIGYLINENELDYWKNIDKNDDLIYAFDPSNTVYRRIYEGQENFKNRFELYAPRETYDYLAICDITNDLVFYQKQIGIFEKD